MTEQQIRDLQDEINRLSNVPGAALKSYYSQDVFELASKVPDLLDEIQRLRKKIWNHKNALDDSGLEPDRVDKALYDATILKGLGVKPNDPTRN